MIPSLLIALQAAAAAAPDGAMPLEFDLKKAPPSAAGAGNCAQQGPSDIVVCARRGDNYRILPMDDRYDEKPLVAEKSIAPGVTARAYGESVDMGQGQISKRAMVGVKVRF